MTIDLQCREDQPVLRSREAASRRAADPVIVWVYILRCSDGSYYTGHSKGDSLERRIIEHQTGFGADWTKRRLPVELMWSDWCSDLDGALSMEKRIKGWTRAKKEALIAGNFALISDLARRRG